MVAPLCAGFQSLPQLPTIKLGPSGADSQVGSLCARSRALWVSPVNSPMRPGVSATPQPPQIFSVRGFEALFPHAGALGCTVCLTPQLFLPVYPGPPATSLLRVLSAWLPISAPPTGLDECFFFISLVVRLPYSSVFCQFWLFFVFKFVVVLLLVVQGGTVYLPMPPSWLEV